METFSAESSATVTFDPDAGLLDDLHGLLDRDPRLHGPALAANLAERSISLIVDVEAASADEALRIAGDALGGALVALGRVASYVTIASQQVVLA